MEAETLNGTATVSERIAQDVAQFNPAEAKLARYRDFLKLTVNGVLDRDGQKMVREARLEVKSERVSLEKLRKAFVEDATKYTNAINAKARTYREEMERIEAHLQSEEDKIERLKEAARLEAEAIAKKRIDDRKMRLYSLSMMWNGVKFVAAYGREISEPEVQMWSDEQFTAFTDAAEQDLAEHVRVEAEKVQAQQAEVRRQHEIAAENERRSKELAEKEAALKAEEDRIAAAARAEVEARERAEREAQIKAEAEERTRKEERERIERERVEAEARAKAEEEARAEEQRQRGDAGVFDALINGIVGTKAIMEKQRETLKSAIARDAFNRSMGHLDSAITSLRNAKLK